METNGVTKSILRIAGAVTAVGVIVGAPFGILTYADDRYQNKRESQQNNMVVKDSILDLRRERVEDEIFRLEQIPPSKRTDAQRAELDRFKSKLRQIDQRRASGP